jgi:hypothetical protein
MTMVASSRATTADQAAARPSDRQDPAMGQLHTANKRHNRAMRALQTAKPAKAAPAAKAKPAAKTKPVKAAA